jgi:hypothetical protein
MRHCKGVMRKGFRVEDLILSLMVWSGMHRHGVTPSRQNTFF